MKVLTHNGKIFTINGSVASDQGISIPTLETSSFTYANTIYKPTVIGYDSSIMTQGGTLSANSAGTYEMIFALKDKENYHWIDGTTEDKLLTWTIEKARYKLLISRLGSSQYRASVMNPTGLENLQKQWELTATASPSSYFTATLGTISYLGAGEWKAPVTITKKTSTTKNGTLRIKLTYTGSNSNIDSTQIVSTRSITL